MPTQPDDAGPTGRRRRPADDPRKREHSVVTIAGLVVVGLIVLVLLAALRSTVNIVQQGQVGVVKRLGEYRKTHEPGLVIITAVRRLAADASTCARSPSPAIART